MGKQILLITGSPRDRWSQLVRDITERDKSVLTVVEPDYVKRGINGHAFNDADFDLTLVDSSTIARAADLVSALHSLSVSKEIIVFTAAPGWRQAREMFHAGADDYRFKSYDVDELRSFLVLALSSK
jgi:DNA-binding response OmpR family regulator